MAQPSWTLWGLNSGSYNAGCLNSQDFAPNRRRVGPIRKRGRLLLVVFIILPIWASPKKPPPLCQVRLGTLFSSLYPHGVKPGDSQETPASLGACRLMGYFHLPHSLFQHSPPFEEYGKSLGTGLFRRTRLAYLEKPRASLGLSS